MFFILFLCFALVNAAPQGYDYDARNMFMQHLPLVMKLLTQTPQTSRSYNNLLPQKRVLIEEPALHPDPFYLPVQQFPSPIEFEYPTANTIQPSQHFDIAAPHMLQTNEPQAIHYESNVFLQPAKYAPPIQSIKPEVENEYNKEFFFVSAEPENEYETDQELETELSKLKKNIRVVFIKSPENNGALNSAAKLIKAHQSKEHTQIYVLTKQHSASDLAKKLQQVHVPAAKPEVVFIKYRTPQEAEEAQRSIQAQYSELNGPNHFSYGNKATVQNIVTKTSEQNEEHATFTNENEYLPTKA